MGCCAEGCIKLLLFIFNGGLMVAGIALLVIGAIAGDEFKEYSDEDLFDDKYLWGPVALAIVVGIVLFFVGISGIGGICCKNKCMLKTYILFLLVLIVLEIVLCVIAFVYRDDGEDDAKKSMRRVIDTAYRNLNEPSKARDVIDKMQRKFDCCGGTGLNDYRNQSLSVPDSCCIDSSHARNCSLGQQDSLFHTKGCAKALFDKIEEYSEALFAIAIVFAILQIVGFVLACRYVNEDKD